MPPDTRALVREATNLAPLPRAALELVAILGRDDWTPEEVLEVVRLDPVLTGKVLGAANSASAAASTKIFQVEDAVRRIGPRAVAGLALASGVKGTLRAALPQLDLGEGELWRHSVAALLAAEAAGEHLHLRTSNAAVTAALLHDVGKVLMARFLDPDTLDYLRLARLEGGPAVRRTERDVLSISHGELGALVVAHWGLPEEIALAVGQHHDLEAVPEERRVDAALVQLADSVAKVVTPPRIRPPDDSAERAAALVLLGVPPERFDGFCMLVKQRFARVGGAY